MQLSGVWPKWLFRALILIVLLLSVISGIYTRKVAQLEQQSAELSKRGAEYQTRVNDLQRQLMVTKTEDQKLRIPEVKHNCTYESTFLPFCTVTSFSNEQTIQKAIEVVSVDIKKNLDKELNNIKLTAGELEEIKKATDDFTKYYTFIEKSLKPLFSIIIFFSGLFVILSQKYGSEHEKWAFGALGTILGVWLK
jgi:hypothetical protein